VYHYAMRTLNIRFSLAVLTLLSLAAAGQDLNPEPYDIGSPTLTELWIDPVHGDDARGGLSAADALRTINAAWNLIPVVPTSTGFRINILPGTLPFDEACFNYFDNRNGSWNYPVIISSFNGSGTVIIEGGLNIANCRSVYLVDLALTAGGSLPTFGNNVLHFEGCTNVLLRRLTVAGPDPILCPDNYDIQEVIKANQCGDIYLEDCDVSGTYQTAVDFFSVQGGHAINSHVHGAAEWAMYLKGGSAYFLIHGNEFYDCGLGFRAGEGSNLEVMRAPWFHYECYDLKFVNNIVHDIRGVGLSVCGTYNFSAAYNTFVRVATNTMDDRDYPLLELTHGSRSCVDTSENGAGNAEEICRAFLDQGAWGTAVLDEEGEWIPNKNVFIYNNIFYNPAPCQTMRAQFGVQAAITPPAITRNIPSPSRCDANAVIRGNLIWNGPGDHPLGIDNSTELDAVTLRSENSINTIEPELVDPAHDNFRPLAGGTVFSNRVYAIPAFAGGDSPYPPAVPPGNLTNDILVDYDGQLRTGPSFAGALAPVLILTASALAADFDGDGKADPAVYDETDGTWRIKMSGSGYSPLDTTFNGLGGAGFVSVAVDYDGDRKADPAVYQELTGIWTIRPSSLNCTTMIVLAQPLGGEGYSGMPADYDGDAKADPGVYQRARGDWKVLLSSANYGAIELAGFLGGTGYLPAAADYDGDHKADPAIYGESTGLWTILLSGANYLSIVMAQSLGGTGYDPVPADYDGDSLADPAVKSAAGNEWIVMFSSNGYTPAQITLLFD